MWSPGEDMPGWMALARYAVFLLASVSIVVSAYMATGFRVPIASEVALIVLFLLYVSLSSLWSTRDIDTYIKSLLVFSTMMMSLSISNIRTTADILRTIFSAISTFVVLSVFVALFVPSLGVETGWEHAGKWRGLAGQKNGLGFAAALALVMGLALPLRRRANMPAQIWGLIGRGTIVLMAALAVYMAASRGGQLMAVVGIASLAIARAPQLLQRISLVLVVLFCVPIVNLAVSTFFIDVDKIGFIGITVDTNSRTAIWEYGLRQMVGHEIFGYGVNGFWTPDRMVVFQDVYGWVLDNFHNGYITIFVEGGLVGILMLLLGLMFLYLLLFVSIGAMSDGVLALSFSLTNIFAINNLVENGIGRSTSLSIIIFAVVSFSIRRHVSSILNK
jgi:O-antigen ligase